MEFQGEKGFTLIEAVIVIVILGVLGAIGAPMLVSATRSYVMERNILSTDAQAQLAMERMVREIRLIDPANITAFTANALSFTLSGAPVSYSVNAQKQLLRNSDILATRVSGVSFAYFCSDWATPVTQASQIWRIQIGLQLTVDQVGTQGLTTSVFLPSGMNKR
jgi:prepilin-type N-terminal cleavage/methylation domain-containing protein